MCWLRSLHPLLWPPLVLNTVCLQQNCQVVANAMEALCRSTPAAQVTPLVTKQRLLRTFSRRLGLLQVHHCRKLLKFQRLEPFKILPLEMPLELLLAL